MPASELPPLFRTASSDYRLKMFDEIDNHKITGSGRHSTQNKRERKYSEVVPQILHWCSRNATYGRKNPSWWNMHSPQTLGGIAVGHIQKVNKNYSCLAPSNELCEFWRVNLAKQTPTLDTQPRQRRQVAGTHDANLQQILTHKHVCKDSDGIGLPETSSCVRTTCV